MAPAFVALSFYHHSRVLLALPVPCGMVLHRVATAAGRLGALRRCPLPYQGVVWARASVPRCGAGPRAMAALYRCDRAVSGARCCCQERTVTTYCRLGRVLLLPCWFVRRSRRCPHPCQDRYRQTRSFPQIRGADPERRALKSWCPSTLGVHEARITWGSLWRAASGHAWPRLCHEAVASGGSHLTPSIAGPHLCHTALVTGATTNAQGAQASEAPIG